MWHLLLALNTVGFVYNGYLLTANLTTLRGLTFSSVAMCAGAIMLVCHRIEISKP